MAKTTPIRAASEGIIAPDQTSTAVIDAESEAKAVFPDPPAAEAPKPANKGGRPKLGAPKDPNPSFFRRVSAVAPEDWGTRAFMYVYCTEPICNLKVFGENKYLFKSKQPINDLDDIMLDYGSFKGYMTLNLRKTGKDATDEIDRFDFEIYNPKHPPKIPRAAWLNDPRNERWAALMPKEAPVAPPTAAGSMIDAMKMYKEIRTEVKEEINPDESQGSTNDILTTMKIAKDLFAPATVVSTPAKDPLELAVALFQTMNQMKAENPVIDMYRDELKAMREELREANAEMRKQKESAPAAKSLADQLLELAALGEKLEPVKKLFGFGNGASGEVVGRAAKTTALDFARDFFESPAGTAVAQGLASLMVNLASPRPVPNGMPAVQQQRTPIVLNPQQSNGTTPPTEDPEARIQRIGQIITQPMLYEYFFRDAGGDAFAQWMFDGMPEDYLYMRQLGAETIVARYRQFPPAWALIAPKEPAFIQFVQEFCAWDPNEDEAPAPGTGEDDGVVDLEAN